MSLFRTYPISPLVLEGAATRLGLPDEHLGGLVWGNDANLMIELGALRAPVGLEFKDVSERPGEPDPRWEDVVELDVQLHPARALTMQLTVQTGDGAGERAEFAVLGARGGGLHRLRVSALGRDLEAGADRGHAASGPELEHYLFELWPSQAAQSPAAVRRGSEPACASVMPARQMGDVAATGQLRDGVAHEAEFGKLFVRAGHRPQTPPVDARYPGGLVNPDSPKDGDDGHAGTVATGFAVGQALVFSEALACPPGSVEAGWEDVSEYSVYVSEGPLVVEGDLEGRAARAHRLDAHGPGWYRLRIHAANRAVQHGGASREPLERYLAQAWPEAEPRDMIVWREEMDAILHPQKTDPHRATDAAPRTVPTRPGWKPRRSEKWDIGISHPDLVMTGDDWHRITTLYGKEVAKRLRTEYKAARGLTTEAMQRVQAEPEDDGEGSEDGVSSEGR